MQHCCRLHRRIPNAHGQRASLQLQRQQFQSDESLLHELQATDHEVLRGMLHLHRTAWSASFAQELLGGGALLLHDALGAYALLRYDVQFHVAYEASQLQ